MKTIKVNQKNATPSKVVCIGRNYVDHIKELNNEQSDGMVIFNKPNAAITDALHYFDEATRFEGEISFVVRDNELVAVGIGLDLTQAKIQNEMKSKGLPWERAKSFDNSAVLSDFVSFDGDVKKLRMELYVNGELRQQANYGLMIYKPEHMIEEIQSFMTLENNDVIMTGTPKGVGNYQIGDVFVGQIYAGDQLLLESIRNVS